MLWFLEERKTRSGTVFASFFPSATLLKSDIFNLASLLQEAIAVESDEQEDIEDLMDELDEPTAPAADDSWLDKLNEPLPLLLLPSRPLPYLHIKRHTKRNKKIAEQGQLPHPATLPEYVRQERTIPTQLAAHELRAAHGAYTAKVGDTYGCKVRRSLPELLGLGFELIQWDGFESRPIVDIHGRIIAALVGQLHSPEYDATAARAFTAIEAEQRTTQFKATMVRHRRGGFVTLNVGLSYGQGQDVPSRLDNGIYASLLARLLRNPDINRMAIFASASFTLWAPRVYAYYRKYDMALHERLPSLQRNFAKTIFSCATFHFGPSVWTFKHRDVLNLPFGMCTVQVLGPFDPTKGGHLILWELKLVIEFPPSTLILLPSANMTHSNIPVQAGDQRASFTQYTAGGIFRYIDNGFRTEKQLEEEDPKEYARVCVQKDARWAMGFDLLSTVDELLEPL
ncbi:hypothetical protein FB451DRAFT_1419628 [Mycena latifolia]|nr:hypothetical protein FB451DRAFT_1419628 [Mycena latifolia]